MIGQDVSHYRIEAVLGEGAAGTVYRASDLNLPGHEVAIKALKPSAEGDRQAHERFLREARALVQIEHPNVVDFLEVVEQDGRQFLVMQFVEGETLRRSLGDGRFETDRALDVAIQICDGLEAAHQRQVIHRDVKPENITITPEGRVKLMDFGIARHLARTQLTVQGALVGTIPYMAPEQIDGQEVTPATDIYAVGVLLYEMLGGQPPFQAETRRQLMHRVLEERPPDLEKQRPELPSALCRLIHRCLEKNPADRFVSAAQLGDALRSIRSGGSATQVIPRLRRRRRSLWTHRVVPAAVLVVAAILLLVEFGPWPSDVALDAPRIMVLPFENAAGDEEMDWLSGAISDVLVAQLNQLGDYEVVSSQTIASAFRHLEVREAGMSLTALRQVADRVGARYLLTGSYTNSPAGTRLSSELTDLSNETAVGRWNHTVVDLDSGLLANVRRLAHQVALSLDSDLDTEPRAVELTESVAALRHYQRGEQRFERADYTGAYDEFGVAVAIDSTFAAAHLWLADLARSDEDAQRHLTDAMRFRERYLPPLPRLVEAEFYQQQGYVRQAVEAYEQVVHDFPLHVHARRSLANIYLQSRRFEESAAAFERVRQNDPYDYSVIPVWWLALFNLGEVDRVEQVLREWRNQRPDEPAAVRTLIRFHQAVGRYELALAECDTLDRLDSGTDLAFRGFLLLDQGRVQEARAVFQEMRDLRDPNFPPFRARVYLAQAGLVAGDYDEALRHVEAALEQVDDTYSHYVAGLVAAAAGRTGLARAHAAAIARGIPGDPADDSVRELYTDRGWYFELTGAVALADGDASEAIEQLETCLRFTGRTATPRVRAKLARACIASANWEAAADQARVALGVNPRHPESLLCLGEAQLELEQTTEAGQTLAQLDDLWKGADEGIPLRRELDQLLTRLNTERQN